MRASILFSLSSLMLVGCGNGTLTVLTVGGQELGVKDQGYYTTTGVDYCNAGAPGQMLLKFVDYNFICDPRNQPERDPGLVHTELDLILHIDPLQDPRGPYTVGTADCTNGPVSPAIANFLHFPANATKADTTTQASSGTISFTQASTTNKTAPWIGSFDLVFNGTHVKDSFTIYACN